MVAKIVIAIGVSVSVTAVVAFSAWTLLAPLAGDVGHIIYQPNLQIVGQSYAPGACQQDYVLWIIPWGQHRYVQANLTLANTGNAPGRATVAFTANGQTISSDPSDFLVQAGQTTTQVASLRVSDCDAHDYYAQISTVVDG